MAITKVQLADPKAIIKLSIILGKKSICEKAFWKFFRSIEKKSILIVSDGHTTKHALQDLAFCLSKRFKDFKIFYKLRPEEYKFWEDDYRVLKNISSN